MMLNRLPIARLYHLYSIYTVEMNRKYNDILDGVYYRVLWKINAKILELKRV